MQQPTRNDRVHTFANGRLPNLQQIDFWIFFFVFYGNGSKKLVKKMVPEKRDCNFR